MSDPFDHFVTGEDQAQRSLTKSDLDAAMTELGSQLQDLRDSLGNLETNHGADLLKLGQLFSLHCSNCRHQQVLVATWESRIVKLEQIVRQLQGLPPINTTPLDSQPC